MVDSVELERLYVSEKKSLADIGRIYSVHPNQVRRWMIKAGIPTRGRSEATSLAQKGKPLSPAGLAVHRAKLEKAWAAHTPESRAKQSETMKKLYANGAPNKGRKWSKKEREQRMALRTSPEFRAKLSAASKSGPDHPNWKGGVVTEHERRIHTYEWHVRRLECYKRDLWLCQDCGCKCLASKEARDRGLTKRKIQAHHIKSRRDGGTDDLTNLVTLCVSCHQRRERLGI